ncbi:MAG: hypothetical protein DRJ52_02265 [Thermoprotei archaeon]|nr:MAG: hypothetical protein DRJ52_02265 [Thermoprotei archaeon]RLF01132.1 MAG: hypothetical protein DRJ63_00060 [Thermoprotei archaeon]HDI75016.1 hypothetical protein [Thermoprotei archaeon]
MLKGYFLPKDLEDNLNTRVENIEDLEVEYLCFKPGDANKIVSYLKKRRRDILQETDIRNKVITAADKLAELWSNREYFRRKKALEVLPKLTGYPSSMIEVLSFNTLSKIRGNYLKLIKSPPSNKAVFKKFIEIPGLNVRIKGYGSLLEKVKLARALSKKSNVEAILHICPGNIPGLVESYVILLSLLLEAAAVVKPPTRQPVFAALFAESLREVDKDLAELVAVVNWRGGEDLIEEEFFSLVNVVNVVGGEEAVRSVKRRVESLRRRGVDIRGCYHGAKFGIELISREYSLPEIAELVMFDVIGYEQEMCSSPREVRVENGGELSPREFAEAMVRSAEWLSKIFPQSERYRAKAKPMIVKAIAESEGSDGVEVFTVKGGQGAIIYDEENVDKFEPFYSYRVIKVKPIDSLEDVPKLLKPYREFMQTAGVAVPEKRILSLADKLAQAGIVNIRVAGSVPTPEPGESWDGKLPGIEFIVDSNIQWVTIASKNIDGSLKRNIEFLNNIKSLG